MESKKTFWKKTLASLAVGGVLLSGLVVGGISGVENPLITEAKAGVAGGGSGGGTSTGGNTNGGKWHEVPKSKLDNGSVSGIPSVYWNDPICQGAVKYFALVPAHISDYNATTGGWTYSLYRISGMSGASFINGPNVANEIAANTNSTYQWASNYMWEKNFICLDDPNQLMWNELHYEVRDAGASTDSLEEEGVHSYITQVAPQPIRETTSSTSGKIDPIGAENLESQSVVATTEFGKTWNAYKAAIEAPGADHKKLVAEFKERFKNAKAADASATSARGNVALSANNQAGLAEGGILNVSEFTKNASASTSISERKYQVWRCGLAYYSKSGWQTQGSCESVAGHIDPNNLPRNGYTTARWKNDAERAEFRPANGVDTAWSSVSATVDLPNQPQLETGFWQILAAHCNEQGIVDLRNAMGADLVKLSGDGAQSSTATTEVSGLLRTKLYPARPSVLPLGDSAASNPAQRATAYLGFYDKECPFDCTPLKNGAGASSANGASNNVQSTGFTQTEGRTDLYGAKAPENVNSSYLEFFRDNAPRVVAPDVWYPVSSQGVNYLGEKPKTTLVTRWAEGTPKLGSEFKASAMVEQADGSKKAVELFTGSANQVSQRNFDKRTLDNTLFSNGTATQVRGLVDEITVQSTWASSLDKPQVLQLAWEYSPSVTSKIPTSIGFASGGSDLQVGSYVDRNTNVDGRCWAEFGTATQTTRDTTASELRTETGTGATTSFSVPNGSDGGSRDLVLNFVRGTSE